MAIKDDLKLERVYIKLGGSCNLRCKYCHAEPVNVQFNPAILPVLKSFNLKRVTFGGGEPLLYWDIIKKIVSYLGNSVQYKVVTNGTLFTEEIVTFCNSYNFLFFVSVDGFGSTRDVSKPVNWELAKKLKHCGTAVTFYHENKDMFKLLSSLDDIKEKYLSVAPWIFSSFPNFVHSTGKNGVLSDLELVSCYVSQLVVLSREAFRLYKENNIASPFLKRIVKDFLLKKKINGVRCCNETFISMLVDGSVCVCPYTLDVVGSIFDLGSLDFSLIKNNNLREDCRNCGLFDVCGNYCCKNVTDHECIIMKKMHSVVISLMNEFNVSYDELESILL